VSDFVTGWCICGTYDKLRQLLHTIQQCLLTISKFAVCYHIICLSSPAESSLKCRYGAPVSDFVTGWCICGSYDKLRQLLRTSQHCLLTISKFAICYHIVCLSSPVEPSLKYRYGVPVSDFVTGWCICGTYDKFRELLHTIQQCLLTISKFAVCYHIVCLSSPAEPT